MRSGTVFFDLTDTADDRFDPIIEWLLIALLSFMPFAFGAVHAWSEAVVITVAAAMSIALVIKLLVRPDVRPVWSWTYVPVAGFLALVLLQLVPLPAALVGAISPRSLLIRQELLADLPAQFHHLDFITLSLYPEGTRHDLRLLVAVAAIFVVCVNVIRQMEQVRRLLAAIAVIGTAVAALAVIQNAFGATKIFFVVPLYSEQAVAGPFVNHSHFGQFMNLSIGATLALLLMYADQLPRNHRHSGSALAREFTRPLTFPVYTLGCAIVLMAVSIPLSLTRGGMVSMFVAGSISAIVMATRPGQRRRGWGLLLLLLVVFVSLLILRFDRLVDRFAAIDGAHSLNARLQILRDATVAWRAFPTFGTGLGTFEQVFPYFDRSSILSLATHAENEYAQLLMETGIVGAVLAAGFLGTILAAYWRCLKHAPSPMTSAAIGLGYGLLAIMVHSATDFGQHIPAIACLTAVACAVLVSVSQTARHGQNAVPRVLFRGARWPRAVGGAVLAVVLALVMTDAYAAWRAESFWNQAARMEDYLRRRNWVAPDDDFYYLIVPAAEAARIRPGNIIYQHQLNYYRWRSISRPSAPGEVAGFNEDGIGYARRIVDELLAAAGRCPTYGQTYWLAGQLQRVVLGQPDGARLVRLGYRLSPTNPQAALDVAQIESEQGNWDRVMAVLRRAIEVDSGARPQAVDLLLAAHRADLALELAGDDIQALDHVAGAMEAGKLAPALVQAARARSAKLIEQRAAETDAPAEILIRAARLHVARAEHSVAIEFFRRALQQRYSQWQWRLELARSLAAAGRVEDALREANIVQRGVEGTKEAEALVAKLSVRLPSTTRPSTVPATSPATPRVLLPRPGV